MTRREFLQQSRPLLAGSMFLPAISAYKDLVIGHGSHQYKVDLNWGNLQISKYPVKDCHEMVQDTKGNLYLLTNHTQNNVLVYNTSGQLVNAWGKEFPGAHGLTISDEGGTEYLYITDYERHEVFKTTLDGKTVKNFPGPMESELYQNKEAYKPTETAVAPNGDLYVADGYGEQWILQYDAQGRLKNTFGGRDHFKNAHGICLDQRNPKQVQLLITAREQNKLKTFSLEGDYLAETSIPGAFICRPVIHGEQVYLATLVSRMPWDSKTGFVCILDKDNQLISVPGGSDPRHLNTGKKLQQTLKIFQHPHDVWVDKDENLYVAQWNSGQTYPIKLIRV